MTSQYRHRRTSVAATPFPANIEPGEIAVNTANRQLALGDAAAGTLGVPLPLLAIRFFDARAQYATNDYVIQNGIVYRANVPITPGAFNAANWTAMAAAAGTFVQRAGDTMGGFLTLHADPDAAMKAAPKQYVDTRVIRAGDTMTGFLTLHADPDAAMKASTKQYTDTKVAKAGDTMSGFLTLHADPDAAMKAATKQYVDTKGVIVTSTTPPGTPPDNTLWWDSDNGMLYVRYNDGNTTQWVSAVPVPDTSVYALKMSSDAQFQALAANGIQINGGFEISQELGATGTGASPAYFCDGWKVFRVGTVAASAAASVFASVPGHPSVGYIVVTTAQPTLGASDFVLMQQAIEGYRVSRLAWGSPNAQPITIGFWSAHDRTGVYSVSVRNAVGDLSCVATYTHNAAGVAQYNTVTLPGCTTGTWPKDNALGVNISFTMAAGSTLTAPSANVWHNAAYFAAPGQTNGVTTNGNVFRITGVVVLPGTHTITAAQSPLLMRPYGEELPTCQRYYQKFFSFFFDSGYSSTSFGFTESLVLPVLMRSAPTVTFANTTYNNSNTVNTVTPNPTRITVGAVCATAGFTSCTTDVIADARL